MCWVALDRAAKLAEIRADRELPATWRATADEIKADILEHGLRDDVLRQHYDTDALDASTLLAAIFGFLPADDERLRKSVEAIADDLTEDGFVLRYRTGETDDGLSGKEGSFLICSFWLVSALAIVGDHQRARDLMERLLSVSSPLGLYAEEFDTGTGRHLGNFPQAFSHLALIEAAARIVLAERSAGVQLMSSYDVIVIGSGAGGGTLVRRLAPSGKRILLLERGDWLPREPQNWSAADVFIDNRYISDDTWYDAETAKAFQPQVHYFVGGATKLYGAALYRLREQDFGELRHHDGISPAWPIGYDEMEPYYTQAEQLYQVHGARGEDPTEPPASAPYPFPAVSHEPRIQQLADDLAAAGHQPFHAPCGVMLNEADMAYSNCVRCPTCDGFPCLVHAKSDAEVLAVRPALEYQNVTLLRNAQAVALHTNSAGTAVTEVAVDREGTRETFSADIVVVSCGAANSAKLLLASATEKHPNGLSNRSDQLGRNYTFHNSQAVLALSKEENPTVFQKTLGLNDFYFGSDDYEYPLGNIQMVGKSSGRHVPRREAARDEAGAHPHAGEHGPPRGRLLALDRGPAATGESRDPRQGRARAAELQADEPRVREAPLPQAEGTAGARRDAPRSPHPAPRLPEDRHPGRRRGPPSRHLPLRHRPSVLGAQHRLPGPRARQPLRRRHELLPQHRRGEPGSDGDGERAAGRRSPARAAGRGTARERAGTCRLRRRQARAVGS